MAVGSIVSSAYGAPRATHDIDLVVAIPPGAASELVAAFPPPDYYLDLQAVREAIAARGEFSMFNLLENSTGDKVDFWVLGDHPYDRECFSRRQVREVLGVTISVQRPEDTILSKLRWAEIAGGSEKQFTDALRVYEVQHGVLDLPYLERWAEALGLQLPWARLKSEAEIL
jgi:hypothetical protein